MDQHVAGGHQREAVRAVGAAAGFGQSDPRPSRSREQQRGPQNRSGPPHSSTLDQDVVPDRDLCQCAAPRVDAQQCLGVRVISRTAPRSAACGRPSRARRRRRRGRSAGWRADPRPSSPPGRHRGPRARSPAARRGGPARRWAGAAGPPDAPGGRRPRTACRRRHRGRGRRARGVLGPDRPALGVDDGARPVAHQAVRRDLDRVDLNPGQESTGKMWIRAIRPTSVTRRRLRGGAGAADRPGTGGPVVGRPAARSRRPARSGRAGEPPLVGFPAPASALLELLHGGARCPRSELHRRQAATSFSIQEGPPLSFGTTCSVVGRTSRSKGRPHQAQVFPSRSRTRISRSARPGSRADIAVHAPPAAAGATVGPGHVRAEQGTAHTVRPRLSRPAGSR